MPREIIRRAEAVPATSMLALAIGAAFGAVAVGALAIGRLALGRVTVKKARLQTLEVDELTVRKLRVLEYDGTRPGERGASEPAVVAQARVERDADGCNPAENEEIAVAQFELGHVLEVHAVDAGDRGRHCENGGLAAKRRVMLVCSAWPFIKFASKANASTSRSTSISSCTRRT